MKVYEITNDKTKWLNTSPELREITLTDEQSEAIKNFADEWAVRISYEVTYEDYDDGDSVSSDIRYKEIYQPHLILCEGKPVGVRLREVKYVFNSSVTETYYHAIYFDPPSEADPWKEELYLEGVRHGNRYVSGYAFYSLVRREKLPSRSQIDTASTEFIPVPSVF